MIFYLAATQDFTSYRLRGKPRISSGLLIEPGYSSLTLETRKAAMSWAVEKVTGWPTECKICIIWFFTEKEKKERRNQHPALGFADFNCSFQTADTAHFIPCSCPSGLLSSQVLACVCVLAEHRPWNPTVWDDGIRSWTWNPPEWTGAFRRGDLRGLPSFPKTQCKGALEQARKWVFTITSSLGQAHPSSLQEPCKRKVCRLKCQEPVTVAWAD